jgi:hypothetical protein
LWQRQAPAELMRDFFRRNQDEEQDAPFSARRFHIANSF